MKQSLILLLFTVLFSLAIATSAFAQHGGGTQNPVGGGGSGTFPNECAYCSFGFTSTPWEHQTANCYVDYSGVMANTGVGCVAHNLTQVGEQGPVGCTFSGPCTYCTGICVGDFQGHAEAPIAWQWATNMNLAYLRSLAAPITQKEVDALEVTASMRSRGMTATAAARERYAVFFVEAVRRTGWKGVEFGSIFTTATRPSKRERIRTAEASGPRRNG